MAQTANRSSYRDAPRRTRAPRLAELLAAPLEPQHAPGPVWSPAILVSYMAAWPAKIGFDDVGEWLPAVCEAVDLDALSGELAGRPRSVWMKAAFVLWSGGCGSAAEVIARAAPESGRGPYKFGVRTQRWGGEAHPEFDVVDYTFVRQWHDPAEHFIQWDAAEPAAAVP